MKLTCAWNPEWDLSTFLPFLFGEIHVGLLSGSLGKTADYWELPEARRPQSEPNIQERIIKPTENDLLQFAINHQSINIKTDDMKGDIKAPKNQVTESRVGASIS